MKTIHTDNLYLFFLRRFYDISTDLDEYSLGEINRFGNNMFMVVYSLLNLAIFLSIFAIADIWGIALLLAWVIPAYCQAKLVKRLGLDKIEVDSHQVQTARRTMLKRTIWQTLIIAVICVLTTIALWRMGIPQEASPLALDLPNRDQIIFEHHFYLGFPILLGLSTLIGFSSFYIANRRKIIILD